MSPILLLAMLLQAIFGSQNRVWSIFLAYDQCGNNAFGGTYGLTISQQVGNALVRGRHWARLAAFIIDALMGKNHCLNNATERKV